jgi:signal transduction histidine kinase
VAAVAAVFVLGAFMSAVLTPLPLTVSSLLPLSLAAHAIGDYTRGWWRGVGLSVVVVGVVATVLASPSGSTTPDSIVPTLMWIGLAFAAGVVAAQHSRRATALQVLLDTIEAGQGYAVRLAVAEQRQHVARDLHDSVAHAMTVVCLHAAAARSNREDEQVVRTSLELIESTVRGAMEELRAGLDTLESADSGEPISVQDLGREVEAIASTIGVRPVVVVSGDLPDFDATAVIVARRVVREALVNVARHARTSEARVRIVGEPTRLLIEITNERGPGPRFDHGSGAGLHGLEELVREHGGRLEWAAPGDAPFRVAAYLPTRAGVPA